MNRSSFWRAALASLLCAGLALGQAQEGKRIPSISSGELSGNTYHNAQLGFSYEFPSGWTVGTATVPEHKFGWKDDPSETGSPKRVRRCSKNLLFVTEHPEGMRPDGFVPMAALFVVDPACSASVVFPNSVGDREAVNNTVNHIEALLDTPPLNNATKPRVRPIEYAGRVLLQISQSMSVSVHDTNTTTNQNLQMSISAMRAREYWIIWLFVAASDSEMSRLKATKVFFDDSTLPATSTNKQ